MWRLGFFFHEIAFGLLSVFIPLYVIALGGSLFDIGVMTSVALLLAIPASLFWGYVCDRTRRYKLYILLSFVSAAILLFLFTFTTSISLLTVLYVAMAALHVAHEAPKNVLIAEHYSHEEWERSYALYEGFTEIGWLVGLILGFLVSMVGFNSNSVLYLVSGLNLVAFFLSLFLVTDPLLIFERRLVSIEKKVDYAFRGVGIVSKMLDGLPSKEKVKEDSFLGFGVGLAFFSLASSLFFTPLPIFFSQQPLSLPPSLIFVIYMLNSGGAISGYFFAARKTMYANAKTQVRRIVLFRSLLIFALIAAVQFAVSTALFAGVILVSLGFAYAVYYILTLSLSMELIPAGKTGVFDVLVSLGAAAGSFLGPLIAETFGFLPQFLVAAGVFFFAYVVLRILS